MQLLIEDIKAADLKNEMVGWSSHGELIQRREF